MRGVGNENINSRQFCTMTLVFLSILTGKKRETHFAELSGVNEANWNWVERSTFRFYILYISLQIARSLQFFHII